MQKWILITVFVVTLASIGGFWIGRDRGLAQGLVQGRADIPGAILVTNVKDNGYILTPLRKVDGIKNIYDVRIIAVSPSYAGMINYHDSGRIMALPSGIYAAEFQMVTEGSKVNCYYRFLVDSSLPLDLPSIDLVANRTRVNVSASIKNGKAVKGTNAVIEAARLNYFKLMNYYSSNIYLATATYDPANRTPPYVMRNPMLWTFKKDFWPGMHLIELHMGAGICSPKLHIYPKTALWIKKLGGKDYTRQVHLTPSDFYKFTLPEQWWREGAEALRLYEQSMKSQPEKTKGVLF